MLISQNKVDRNLSVYSCDRCNAQMNIQNKISIYVALPTRQPRKKWDLCKRCYGALVRGINKKLN